MTARGIRNNNPGNIRLSKTVWRGEVKGTDSSFKTFGTMAWGIRAIYHLLNNYRVFYGLDTLTKLIDRWAPESDGNNTAAYIANVSRLSGVSATGRITTTNKDVMEPIVREIIRQETGTTPSVVDMRSAWDLFVKYRK